MGWTQKIYKVNGTVGWGHSYWVVCRDCRTGKCYSVVVQFSRNEIWNQQLKQFTAPNIQNSKNSVSFRKTYVVGVFFILFCYSKLAFLPLVKVSFEYELLSCSGFAKTSIGLCLSRYRDKKLTWNISMDTFKCFIMSNKESWRVITFTEC